MVNTTCPYPQNTDGIDQSTFFSSSGINWDAHRIGWVVAGSFAIVTTLLTIYNVWTHARNYYNRREQRQIIRILYMPMVYAIISFFSYRFFRKYTYYSLVESAYEALVIGAFLLLLVQFVADTAVNKDARKALERKEKQKLPFPFCFIRYRPTKPYFMYTLKYAVLQYCAVRPFLTIVGMITEKTGRLCTGSYSPVFAYVYIDAIDFVSITFALYGLIVFYVLTRHELEGRRPLAKFLCIKLIVFFTFYQGFLFSVLASHGVIKATTYWTTDNVADGLSALVTCIEMLFFSCLMLWAFPAREYYRKGEPKTNIFRPLWDSINFSDFVVEIWYSIKFFFDFARGKPYARAKRDEDTSIENRGNADFDTAFGIESSNRNDLESPHSDETRVGGRYDNADVPADKRGVRTDGRTRGFDGGYNQLDHASHGPPGVDARQVGNRYDTQYTGETRQGIPLATAR